MINLVNTDKLYAVIGNFFTSKDNLLLELIQNAQRAKAKKVTINAPHTGTHPFAADIDPNRLLSIIDDGQGIDDIVSLFGIAFSNWDADIESQHPAGMGFLQLLALAEQVYIRSRFGELWLDCDAFLKNPEYRQLVVESVYAENADFIGTEIHALMKYPAWMYLKSDTKWYTGFLGMELTINGKVIEHLGMRERIKQAQENKSLYNLTRFKGNSILIEVGYLHEISSLSRSLVNWYGQLIPFGLGSGSLAGNNHMRVYYEVSLGTPLTPRYPDRTSFNYDEKVSELQAFVNTELAKMLLHYFTAELKTPLICGAIDILGDMYRHLEKDRIRPILWIPARKDILQNGENWDTTLLLKSELIGYRYCTSCLQVDEEYNLGADLSNLKIIQVSDYVAPYLQEIGLKELTEITAVNPPDRMITLEPLQLRFINADGSEEKVIFPEALLCNNYNEVFIYAPRQNKVLGVFDDYCDETVATDDERRWDDLKDDLRKYLIEAMVEECQTVHIGSFDFLPQYHTLKNIVFTNKEVRLEYTDGETRIMQLEEAI